MIRPLQGHGNNDSQAETKTGVNLGSAGNGDSAGGSRHRRVADSAWAGGDGRGHRSGGLRDRSSGRDRDLRDRDLRGDCAGSAAGGDGDTVGDARLSDSGGDDNSGVGHRGDSRGTSDSDDVGDGLNASDNAGVLRDVRGADALDESKTLRDDIVRVSVGIDASIDLVEELLVGAEAGNVQVVLALLDNVEEGVQARGDNRGARQRLLGLLRVLRLLGALSGLRGRRDGLGDRADGGADGNSVGDDSCLASTRAVRNLRSTAGDGLNGGGEDSRGAVVGGGDGSGHGRASGRALGGAHGRRNRAAGWERLSGRHRSRCRRN
jgi:hypothetical protein